MIILLQYETPPIFREESSSADEKEFVSPLLKGNSVTKVNEVLIDTAPRNDEDEKKAKKECTYCLSIVEREFSYKSFD